MKGLYLGLLPTPGGDKYHLFDIRDDSVVITNDMGPKDGTGFRAIEGGIAFVMPTGPVDHKFELQFDGMVLKAKVGPPDSDEAMASFEIKLVPAENDVLPENPPAPEGADHGGPEEKEQ